MLVPRIRRLYFIAVGAEIAARALGAVVLTVAGASGYIAPWVLAVVGAHFVPLARLFAMPELTLAGLALIAAAAGSTATGVATGLAPSFTAGAAGGLVCVASAGYRLLAGHRGLVRPGPHAAGRQAPAAGRQASDG